MSRRNLLRTIPAVFGSPGMYTLFPDWARSANPTVEKGIRTVSGTEFGLVIDRKAVVIDGRQGEAITINGQIPAPFLRWREGDDIVLRVTNRLEEDTSIHWHGILVPFQMDGVPAVSFPGIKPGETFTYRFRVPQSGTYWYHSPSGLQLRYAEDLRASFSGKIQSAAREPLDATALVYAMLLSRNEGLRAKQPTELAKRTAPGVSEATATLWPEVAPVVARVRLPLANLALPALRQLRPDEFQQFSRALQWPIESDEQIEVFEFVLQKIVRRHLAPLGETHSTSVQYHTPKPLITELRRRAFGLGECRRQQGRRSRKGIPDGHAPSGANVDGLQLLPREECGLEQLDTALDHLALAVPQMKKKLIEVCVHVVGADGFIQEREAESAPSPTRRIARSHRSFKLPT